MIDIVPALIEPMVSDRFAGVPFRFPWPKRVSLALVATVLAGLLVTARFLEPSSTGVGTHQQLGFPVCTIQQLFSIRCPACGMTTSWAYFVRGNWLNAWKSNSGGTLLAGSAVVFVMWLTISAVKGRWVVTVPSDWLLLIFFGGIVVVTTIDWLVRVLPDQGS